MTAASYVPASPDGSSAYAPADSAAAQWQNFKWQYYRNLSPIYAYTKTKVKRETINDPGVLIYVNQPGQQPVVFRMQRQGMTWAVNTTLVL